MALTDPTDPVGPTAEWPTTDRLTWGVRRGLAPVALGLALLAVVWLVLARAPEDRLVAGMVAAALVITAVVALRLRERLAATADGFVVRSVFGQRFQRWQEVSRISSPTRHRRGWSTTTLEVDLADDSLIVLGRLDLGADPTDVAAALRTLAQQGTK